MAENMVLNVETREGKGGRAAARLRAKGKVPGVVYGHKESTASVSIDKVELANVLRHHVQTVELVEKGKKETALIQEVQHCHLGKDVLHVDFRRVSADEMVTRMVPVELRGVAPGASSGVVDQPLHTIHVRCPVLAIPESIRVNVDKLMLGMAIHVHELVLPPNVTVLENKDAVVVQIKQRSAEPVVGAGLPGEGGVEPEVITAKKKADEAEE